MNAENSIDTTKGNCVSKLQNSYSAFDGMKGEPRNNINVIGRVPEQAGLEPWVASALLHYCFRLGA